MALFTTDWRDELAQVKDAIGDVVDAKLNPMIGGAISQADLSRLEHSVFGHLKL